MDENESNASKTGQYRPMWFTVTPITRTSDPRTITTEPQTFYLRVSVHSDISSFHISVVLSAFVSRQLSAE